MLENLNGFLLVDKPAGIAFSTVVKTIKRKFNLVKVGHGGSLDAAASGLLVLLINDANKFVGDVMGPIARMRVLHGSDLRRTRTIFRVNLKLKMWRGLLRLRRETSGLQLAPR